MTLSERIHRRIGFEVKEKPAVYGKEAKRRKK
jgi:hypothetical protein